MKKALPLILLLTAVLGFAPRAAASDRWETLRAINWVENPTNHSRYGSKGELGPYQFRSGTWRMHTKRPFTQAVQREAADEVAVAHYEWIKDRLEEAGVEASIFNIAMAWNCGVSAVIKGRAPVVSFHYAEQVVNLVEQQKREQAHVASARVVAAAPQPPQAPVPAPSFRVDANAPRLVIAGVEPRYQVRVGEPEIAAVIKTEPATENAPLFVVSTTLPANPTFSLKPAVASLPRLAFID
jgi:hypothetical protein